MAYFTTTLWTTGSQMQNISGALNPSAPNGGIYLYASGAVGAAKLYVQNEGVANASAVSIADLGGGIDEYTNGANNRVITALDSTGINGEANLTFDGTTLLTTGLTNTGDTVLGTTPGEDVIQFSASFTASFGGWVLDDQKLYFGTGKDVSLEYDEDDTDTLLVSGDVTVADDKKLYFGTGKDASFEYDEDGNDVLLYAGANMRISDDVQLQFGAGADATFEYDEDGNDVLLYGGANFRIGDDIQLQFGAAADASIEYDENGTDALIISGSNNVGTYIIGGNVLFSGSAGNEKLLWSANDNTLSIVASDAKTIVTLGGDAVGEYAIDVTEGTDARNKIRATAFVTYSDEDLKENVQQMSNALDTVKSLKGVDFTWKKNGSHDIGFIAQEVEKLVPEVVHDHGSTGVKGVDYSRLTPILVEAIKEQQKQIEELKERLDD
tara:strand:+ start:2174 stop:3487 length:1314 start_codon:yes stop_codon:yes gene_type:complete